MLNDVVKNIIQMQRMKNIDEMYIYNTFKYYGENDGEKLEELKNLIDDESDDYLDLMSLLDKLSNKDSILEIFKNNKIPDDSNYKTKLLVDIDNTLIENDLFAVPKYKNGDIICGIIPLIKLLAKNTTVVLLSARPHLMEKFSIKDIKKKINGEFKYSFMGGNMKSIFDFITGNKSESYKEMAIDKYNNYLKLLNIYPNCSYVFFGDDTQGDYMFAQYYLHNNPNNLAIIRQCDPNKYIVEPIIYHNSYLLVAIILYNKNMLTDLKYVVEEYIKYINSRNSIVYEDKYYYELILKHMNKI